MLQYNMFNKYNFIVDLNINDKVLKLRNSNNFIQYLIKDPYCSIIQNNNTLHIKQKSESNTIKLDFNNDIEAHEAHVLLRNALLQLVQNITPVTPIPSEMNILTLSFIPTLTDSINNSVQYFNTNIYKIIGLYVNGVLQNNDQYLFIENTNYITWLASAEIILEPTDLVTIIYYEV